uniref:Uncharacterized protein LOC104213700 n=1 Tax=Nicotiana sylvestris TaxID=4096 RepID=A0A1U7V975_NICSY|nr:PREDICTED: uncharacterized protein LOC104213700 [Nicotiana sylvestris]
MEEAHFGSCGAYQSGPKLHFRIKRMGYYWPTMVEDCMEHAKRCQSSKGQMYILASIDYFSRWAEVVPLKEVKKEIVVDFIESNIIFRYGIPRYIIIDNGTPFDNKLRDWHKKIGEALWAYRTTFRTATQTTPYSLVYGVEVVLSLEQQIPSLQITIQEGLTSKEYAQLHVAELEALDEKRLEAQQKLVCYQARLARASLQQKSATTIILSWRLSPS